MNTIKVPGKQKIKIYICVDMARNTHYIAEKNMSNAENAKVKDYSNSPNVVKKTEQARETLAKFPVPEKYAK